MRKRYKLLLCFLIPFVFLVIIYFITKDTKLYYLSIGDSLSKGRLSNKKVSKSYSDYVYEYLKKNNNLKYYSNYYTNSKYRSIDLLNIMNKNQKIKNKTIMNELIKADLVTVSIGMNDLFYKLNVGIDFFDNDANLYTYIDEVMVDLNKFLYKLRLSCKEQIIVLGYYNPFLNYSTSLANNAEPYVVYANSKLINLLDKYEMYYVDLHSLFIKNKDCLPNFYEIHPNKEGYEKISEKIIDIIKEKNLQKH